MSAKAWPSTSDRCPYARPFPPEFAACPAYQQTSFIAADSSNHRLGTHLTCRHLAVGSNADGLGGFYGRCSLGSRIDRLRWVAEVRPERLEAIQATLSQLDEIGTPSLTALFEAKAAYIRNPGDKAARTALDRVLTEYLATLKEFCLSHADQLAAVGLPGPPLHELFDEWLTRWAARREMTAVGPDPARLAEFEEPIRAVISAGDWRAELADDPRLAPAARCDDDLAPLQVFVGDAPHELRLVGDIDSTTVPVLRRALWDVAARAGRLDVDFSGIISCDMDGLRALIEVARANLSGNALVLRGVPGYLEKVMAAAGWGDLPEVEIVREVAS